MNGGLNDLEMSWHHSQPQHSPPYRLTCVFPSNWSTWLSGYLGIKKWITLISSKLLVTLFWIGRSARNDLTMIIQGHVGERNSNFLIPTFHSLICLQIINFNYAVNYSTLSILTLPRDFLSTSRLVKWAENFLLTSSPFKVISSLPVAQAKL